MELKEYNRKRKFNNTPEPKGIISPSGKNLSFVVQKHDASKLHYDFRLELDGVLKSWAIPKGPSLNPKDKRLAMPVEDHPLSYSDFEGTIPEGNYGAGEVIVWDRGYYNVPGITDREQNEEILRKGLRDGNMTFVLNGKKLRGEFSLRKINFRGKDSWLLIKKKDEYASEEDITLREESVLSGKKIETYVTEHSASQPKKNKTNRDQSVQSVNEFSEEKIKPMLANLVKSPFDDKHWLFEVKYDGYRAIGYIKNGSVNLLSRNNKKLNDRYPKIAEELKNIQHQVIIDGEITVLDKSGKFNFQMLQNYQRTKEGDLVYYVFDILFLDNRDLRDLPLKERKKMLKEVLPESNIVRFSSHIKEHGITFFNAARKQGQEGIIAKNADSPYRTSSRSSDWLKIKTHMRQEAVICGFTNPRGSRQCFGALVLGIYDSTGILRYIGHAGGGFNKESLKEVYSYLEPLIQKTSPFSKPPKTNMPVTWVKPELVCEVSFSEWTKEGQLRQPIFEGLREDKNPEDVIREKFAEVTDTKEKSLSGKNDSSSSRKYTLTNLTKLYWPEEGITKGDLVNYYKSIAKYILPYLKNRPHTLLRHPNGIKEDGFFQKDVKGTTPDWIKTADILSESNNKEVTYLVCTSQASLLYMVNLGCIEINPWSSRVNKLDSPDYMVIDLDPLDIGFDKVIETSLVVKEVLDEAKAKSYCKTSGATGMHIYVPLNAKYDFQTVKDFAILVAQLVHQKLPDSTSLERSPAKRKGKVYIDYLQNKIGQTLVAPYSVRPRPYAPVSTPLKWEEVKPGLDPRNFTIKDILKRVKKSGDIFKKVLGTEINLIKCIKNIEVTESLK